MALGFQILAGMIGPSHAHGHVVDWGGQVNVFGMTVKDGDIVHADRHGAVVVPHTAVPGLPAAVALVQRREKVVLQAARADGFDIDKLKKAMADQAEIH
jgi:regulator of RNase E activity RraA